MLARDWIERRALAVVACLILIPGPTRAQDQPKWRVEGGVVVVVPVKPGGTFEAKTSALEGALMLGASSPLSFEGELSVSLATIETGIALRDRHLAENYLEIGKGPGFDTAVLSEIVLVDAGDTAFRGRSAFNATLLLHGVSRPVAGEGKIVGGAAQLRVHATFPLSLVEFGIEPPSYKGVGVANKLLVKVTLHAVPSHGAGG